MALPADFSKIFGSTATGGLTPIGDVNYAKGWEFVGSNPPTKNDFTYLQNLSDLKSQWLYSNKLQRTDPFGDIKSDGATAIATALSNLGLGAGSALPVGVPVPWPSATPPAGWLKCNGAPFSAEEYPDLAKAYPTNKLPDLRGEFIRGWDDGRGIDAGREILSAQGDAIRNITGSLGFRSDGLFTVASGVFSLGPEGIGSAAMNNLENASSTANFDASTFVPTASENRPRSIAFNFIVRAA